MALTTRRTGQTVLGWTRTQSELAVDTASGTASVLTLLDSAGGEHFLWVDTTGDLRIHTSFPVNFLTDGTVVGGQS